jgi:hypothetical protein
MDNAVIYSRTLVNFVILYDNIKLHSFLCIERIHKRATNTFCVAERRKNYSTVVSSFGVL